LRSAPRKPAGATKLNSVGTTLRSAPRNITAAPPLLGSTLRKAAAPPPSVDSTPLRSAALRTGQPCAAPHVSVLRVPASRLRSITLDV
jgi:hypothetical protein